MSHNNYGPEGRSRRRRRVGRRGLLRGSAAAALGLAGAGLIGCGGDDETASTATSTAAATVTAADTPAQPQQGGTFRGASTLPLQGLDLHSVRGGGTQVVPRVYNYLYRMSLVDTDFGIINDLSEKHELLPDNRTWVFTLRRGVKIAPNTLGIEERELTSDDVAANFERSADPAAAASGLEFIRTQGVKWETPDEFTFRLTTEQPYAWTESTMGNDVNFPLAPREVLERADLGTEAVGAGPFMIDRVSERTGWTLARNPNYYQAGKPYLDSYDTAQFSDVTTWRAAFESGEVDIYAPANVREAEGLAQQLPQLTSYRQRGPAASSYLHLNMKFDPWKDERARRAVDLGMNRQEFIDVIADGAGDVFGAITPVFRDYALSTDEILNLRPFDPKEAASLFQAAGITEWSFEYPSSGNASDFANVLVKQMSDLGVKVTGEAVDIATWLADLAKSQFKSGLLGTGANFSDPDTSLKFFVTGGRYGNGAYSSSFSDPDVDKAIEEASRVVDVNDRIEAYAGVQRLLLSKAAPPLFIANMNTFQLLQPRVQGYADAVQLANALTHDVWIDDSKT